MSLVTMADTDNEEALEELRKRPHRDLKSLVENMVANKQNINAPDAAGINAVRTNAVGGGGGGVVVVVVSRGAVELCALSVLYRSLLCSLL